MGSISSFFKDKVLKAADIPDEDYDEGYDEYEDYDEDEEEEVVDNSSKSDNSDFGFDFSSDSKESYSAPNFSSKKTKFTSNEGGNIYKMNNNASYSKTEKKKIDRVFFFTLREAEDARTIADCMIAKDCIILADLSGISTEDCNKVLNFLDGVRYICKSQIENINGLQLIVPESIMLSGDFYDQVAFGPFSQK